jgi:transcription initiation factor IIE alpha subunit
MVRIKKGKIPKKQTTHKERGLVSFCHRDKEELLSVGHLVTYHWAGVNCPKCRTYLKKTDSSRASEKDYWKLRAEREKLAPYYEEFKRKIEKSRPWYLEGTPLLESQIYNAIGRHLRKIERKKQKEQEERR